MPKQAVNKLAEWRGWIWIAVFLFISLVGAGFGLFSKAEAYADKRVNDLREEIKENVGEMKKDIRLIRADIKELLKRR